jgi:hypothetical protein
VFFCNVALTADEKSALAKHARKQGIEETDVFDRERIRIVLDSPEGLSIRFQYLDLELSSAEQSAFFARWGSDIESLISSSFDTVATRLSRIEFFMERERPPSLNGNSLALRVAMESCWAGHHHESVSEGYPGDECGGIERSEDCQRVGSAG